MAARTGRLTKPDAQGHYVRQLGWKLNVDGRKVQHKFRLGTDKREAERRDGRLRELWEQIEKHADLVSGAAIWDDVTLHIAKQIALGVDKIPLAPLTEEETPTEYARRLQRIQNSFPFLRFEPSDTGRYTQGAEAKTYDIRDIVLLDNLYEMYWQQRDPTKFLQALPLRPELDHPIVCRDDRVASPFLNYTSVFNDKPTQPATDGATLHQAFDSYSKWIREHYFDEASQTVSEYGHTKLGQVETLKARHVDEPLTEIDYDYIEKMYRFWRQRPLKRSRTGQEQRISPASVRHYIGELHRFFKWLHRSKDFAWTKPQDLDDIDRTVSLDTKTVKRRIRKVDTFQLEELRLLNRYATPIERLYLMLGLNCGFGTKEIATLTIGEIFLHQALPLDEQEVFGFSSTGGDSFVSLVRNKTTIVGKYLLFQQTTQLLEWILDRRRQQPHPTADQPAILNSQGKPLDRRSQHGNPSRQIPNSFARLQKRIVDDGNEIRAVSFFM